MLRGRGVTSAVTIAAALALGSLNSTSVLVVLDDIEQEFSSTAAASASIVAVYLIGMASVQPLTGRIGDRLGKRPLVIAGLIGFGISSAAIAISPNIALLIVFRAAQAAFIAAVIPNAAGLVRDKFPQRNRARWTAAVFGVSGVAGGLGPLFGGVISELLDWRYVFLVNLPFALMLALFVYRVIGRDSLRTRTRHVAIRNGILTFAVLATSFAILTIAALQDRPDSRLFALAIAIGGAGILILLYSSFMQKDVPLKMVLVTQRALGASVVVAAAGTMAMYLLILATAFLLTLRSDLSDDEVGLILGFHILGVATTYLVGGWLADRFSRRAASIAGRTVLIAGALLFAVSGSDASVTAIAAALFIGGAGMGLSNAAIRVGTLEAVDVQRSGMAFGLFSTSRYAGSIGGAAAFAAIVGSGPLDSGRFTVMLYFAVAAAVASVLAAFALSQGERRPVAPGAM